MLRGWDDHDMGQDGCLRHQHQMDIVQQWVFPSSPLGEFGCESGVTPADAQRDAALHRLHECNGTSCPAFTITTGFPGAAVDAGERFDLLACHRECCASANLCL